MLQHKLQIVMFLNEKLYISCQSRLSKFILRLSNSILAEIKIPKTSFYSTKWYIMSLQATSCRRKAFTRVQGFPSPYNPNLPPLSAFVKLPIYNYSLIVKLDLLAFINIRNRGSFSTSNKRGRRKRGLFVLISYFLSMLQCSVLSCVTCLPWQ